FFGAFPKTFWVPVRKIRGLCNPCHGRVRQASRSRSGGRYVASNPDPSSRPDVAPTQAHPVWLAARAGHGRFTDHLRFPGEQGIESVGRPHHHPDQFHVSGVWHRVAVAILWTVEVWSASTIRHGSRWRTHRAVFAHRSTDR